MIELKGKYENAIIYNDFAEEGAISQIISLLNQPMAKDAHVRVMPDVHAGAGCVIGYTAKLTDKVVPNLIGVDIGCGVLAVRLSKKFDLDDIEKFTKENIPTGSRVRGEDARKFDKDFHERVLKVCRETGQDFHRVMKSLGTLGGGNHFIEIDEDNEGKFWLLAHTGSRNFGKKIAEFHQDVAKSINYRKNDIDTLKQKYTGEELRLAIEALPKTTSGLEWLEGDNFSKYLEHMMVAQEYASINRNIIIEDISAKYGYDNIVESVHNYIDLKNGIIRKGAISAQKGEKVIIPLSMKDGAIIGTGKGNEEWNFSAPHGAGRKMSRSEAKKTLSMEEFEEQMKGIKSSCIGLSTLDESPMAYKDPIEIIRHLEPSVEIVRTLKPIWNFKAT